MPISIKSSYELQERLNKNKNVFVMFTATWCAPCKTIKPAFIQYSDDSNYKHIEFVLVDIDEAEEMCIEYNIRSVPTFIMFVDKVAFASAQGANVIELQKILDATN